MRVANDPRRRQDAVAAAVAIASRVGLAVDDPVVLHDGSNVLVHLRPAAIVARVPTTTALARGEASDHLAREVTLARALAAAGAAVLAPTTIVDPGPHRAGDHVATLWPLVESAGGPPDMEAVGRSLAQLHRALNGLGAGALTPPPPLLNPAIDETAALLHRLEALGALAGGDAELVLGEHECVVSALRASPLPVQVLHGDAHARNVLATPDGPLWFDFEDCCAGPVAWDLACLIAPSAPAAGPALEAYAAAGGTVPPDAQLAPFLDARELQVTAWSLLFATRFPEVEVRARRRIDDLRRRIA